MHGRVHQENQKQKCTERTRKRLRSNPKLFGFLRGEMLSEDQLLTRGVGVVVGAQMIWGIRSKRLTKADLP